MENEGKIIPLHPENEKSRDDILLENAKMACLVGEAAILLDDPDISETKTEDREVIIAQAHEYLDSLTEEEKDAFLELTPYWEAVRGIFTRAMAELKGEIEEGDSND